MRREKITPFASSDAEQNKLCVLLLEEFLQMNFKTYITCVEQTIT